MQWTNLVKSHKVMWHFIRLYLISLLPWSIQSDSAEFYLIWHFKWVYFRFRIISTKVLPCNAYTYYLLCLTLIYICSLNCDVTGFTGRYLFNIWQMFNVAIDNLAVKPYIPNKSLLQRICWNCLLRPNTLI